MLSTALIVAGLMAQTFDAASVHPHEGTSLRTGRLAVSGTLIRLQGYTVFGLVMDAWDLRDFQVIFGEGISPEDMAGAMYDVVARAPGDVIPKASDARAMLRNLLAERFKLAVHHETREISVYALVRDPGRPLELSTNKSSGACSIRESSATGRNIARDFTNCDANELADALGHLIRDRPIVDETGLNGNFDFRLVAAADQAVAEPDDISPFTAIAKLGLKLVKQKSAADVVVIDRLERPTAN